MLINVSFHAMLIIYCHCRVSD
uniref:Uncharacterized protein n=1 Tax=Arundo donax TaxID=35708 RepID=A0A0A9BM01_ARUDO